MDSLPAEQLGNPLLSFSSVQSLSHVQFFSTSWTAAHQASLSITNSWSLLKCTSIESVMPSNHLILCCPLLLPPSIFPSIRVFSKSQFSASGGQSIFNISPSNEHSGLISFRMDWLDLLAEFTLPVVSAAKPLSPKYFSSNLFQTCNINTFNSLQKAGLEFQ